MKKREVLLFLLVLLSIGVVYSQQGSVGTGLSIIDTTGPIITLTEPLNNSGDNDGNITFFYSASDASSVDNCSLIINNKINVTTNLTLKNTRLNFTLNNTPIGSYNWSINCTDNLTYISSSPQRTFSVIFLTKFDGNTTNISSVSDIRNITNFVLEIITFGRINFSDSIDLSRGLDLDKYINISLNRIELNSSALRALNRSATLYLYNITYDNPRPLRDGAICPSDICTEIPPYSGGIFVFNVTQFTVYSSEETPAEPDKPTQPGGAPSSGGGGGGGLVGVTSKRDFTISKDTLKVVLKQGQTKEETIDVKNTGDVSIDVITYLQALKQFIFSPTLDEIKIILNPDEEQMISLTFRAEEDQKPDIYTGKITLKSGSIEKIINTIIEVESAKPLFDVDVEVLPEYKSVAPGEEIIIEVSTFNVRGFGRVDVNLEYSIRDFNGNIIVKEEETVAVETQAKFVRELSIPSDLKQGTYIAAVKVTFEDSVGTSSDVFEVKAKAIRLYPIEIRDNVFYILLGVVFVVFIASIFLIHEFGLIKRKYLPKTKEEEDKLLKTEVKVKKLEKELAALMQGFKSKFISEESYKKGKGRIERVLKKLKK